MRFLTGLVLGIAIGGVLTILATGNAGQALQSQLREQSERQADRETNSGDGSG